MILINIENSNVIIIQYYLVSKLEMHSFSQGFYPYSGSKMHETTSTWISKQESNYLANVNYKLVNEINESETQKHFYKTKLAYQFKNHHCQLHQAFQIISQRNAKIIDLEEELDRCMKDLRSAADDYISLKRKGQDQKQYYDAEMANMKATCDQKIRKFEQQNEKKYQLKLKKRVQQVENECNDRIKMYTEQINILTQNSKKLAHQLSMLQEDYRQMLLKNDTIIQESIHRELRKRDFQAQNNYLRDLAQYETIKKQRNQLKQTIDQCNEKIKFLEKDNKRLVARLEVQSQKMKDLEQAFEDKKKQEKTILFQNYKELNEAETNTDKHFVPIAMPIDLDLMSEVVSLRDFLIEKIVFRFMDFFEKSTGSQVKKTAKSLLVFTNCLEQIKSRNPQIKILLFLHSNIEKIIKIYCPSLNNLKRDYLTIKDEFIKKTLMQCETITNQSQRLFRILDLFFRIKNPLNHLRSQITPGELKLVQIKLLTCLKKNFS